MSELSRRDFLRRSAALGAGLFGLGIALGRPRHSWGQDPKLSQIGFGPLVPDPRKVIDLPQGFRYSVFSRTGETMDDGLLVPAAHDGMAAFSGPDGKTLLVRNHEQDQRGLGAFGPRNDRLTSELQGQLYDDGHGRFPCLGGTTTLVFDTRAQKLEQHSLSLAGTDRNCAGGPTPWGSWISCEESTRKRGDGRYTKDHGYPFEVPARAAVGLAEPVPLKALGRFNHEAVAIDPKTGIVYQTEDTGDGAVYRLIPTTPGKLREGGRLQALALTPSSRPKSGTTYNTAAVEVEVGKPLLTYWVDVEDVESPNDDLRHQAADKGAVRFRRGEGMWYGGGAIYFTCTSGGKAGCGQIWRYEPSKSEGQDYRGFPQGAGGTLTLLCEPNDPDVFEMVDNLTVSPWGDLFCCEDGRGDEFIRGVTRAGRVYTFARNALNTSEFAGGCFSPDGSTMFVNIQRPGLTLAITGPWPKQRPVSGPW